MLSAPGLSAMVLPQVPNPSRTVHPAIADAPPAIQPFLTSSPMFAFPDGIWNHGEGFATSGPHADTGAWHATDTGIGVTDNHVHVTKGWLPYAWTNPLPPFGVVSTSRFVGYLRPESITQSPPPPHPLYGAVGPYVDQGAFELFVPQVPLQNRHVLICLLSRETVGFPADYQGNAHEWRTVYRGIFSPDGLVRPEQARTASSFLGNIDPDDVDRPNLNVLQSWDPNSDYWPVLAYPVLSVMHRSTSLNEQRQLQLVQAVKLLLQRQDETNPLYHDAANPGSYFTPAEVDARVVVCFLGGSNGGLQGQLAALNHPNIVHGCYAEVISPSLQRFYGENDMGQEVARRSGEGFRGSIIDESDFLWWNQYFWSWGLEAHDASFSRMFVNGSTLRPACFVVGDEDITSTGTDWARMLTGTWQPSGVVQSSAPFGMPGANRLAWMVAEATCHTAALVPTQPPYAGYTDAYGTRATAHGLFTDATAQRDAEYLAGQQAPAQPLVSVPRTPSQQRFGLDDPQEWFLGRAGEDAPLNQPSDLLQRDDAWFDNVQPDTAGTMPGAEESMFIRDGFLFTGCTEGFVSKFEVDTSLPEMPLRRVARSSNLGSDLFALAPVEVGGTWSIAAGTRRHLCRLDANLQTILAGPVELPWEVSQPRHMQVGDVLPGRPTQLIFHSVHGGLVFYNADTLAPIFEWPEPGIMDFAITGAEVTILSARGLLANVTFSYNGTTFVPSLGSASKSYPTTADNWTAAAPCMGVPGEMELMIANLTGVGAGSGVVAISTWSGDTDGNALRAHLRDSLFLGGGFVANTPPISALATCRQPAGYGGSTGIGDHALLLTGPLLTLFDQAGQNLGGKILSVVSGGAYYPFGRDAQALAVGNLVDEAADNYSEEVVIATKNGLMWMDIDDLIGGSLDPLPASYAPKTVAAGGPGDKVQPYTNTTMAAAWAISTDRPGGLHVLDQRGAYWVIDATGGVTLQAAENVAGARQWDYVGVPSQSGALSQDAVVSGAGAVRTLTRRPWCPIAAGVVPYENNTAANATWLPNNWSRRPSVQSFFDGWVPHRWGGCAVPSTLAPLGSAGLEVWSWSAFDENTLPGSENWGNSIEAFHISSAGVVDGIWASSKLPAMTPPSATVADRCPHHSFRSSIIDVIPMTQQSASAVEVNGEVVVFLGCPGGRVQVITPAGRQVVDDTSHEIGNKTLSPDLGFGGSALATRLNQATGVVTIWFGTISHPTPQPNDYALTGGVGFLKQDEVATGALHMMQWSAANGLSGPSVSIPYYPSAQHPRGAYGVVGLGLGDIAGTADEELVVGTISGDLIVYDAMTLNELWRTHVPGAVGWFNSIVIDDLDQDGSNELYVGGSWGIWKFTP